MIEKQPHIAIILIDYNSKNITEKCIESLKHLDYENFDIIIVDNSSKIEFSDSFIKKQQLHYIKNSQNLGFAKACNIGIKYAQSELPSDYFWILNNDTTVARDSLKNMVNRSTTQNYAITGSKIIDPQTTKIQCLAGGYLNKLIGKSNFIKKDSELQKLEYICGASMLIAKNTITKVGYFDEDFFLYYEDNEFCRRALEHGLTIGYCEEAEIFHIESSTTGKIPRTKIFYTSSSFVIFCLKTKQYLTLLNGLILRFSFYLVKIRLDYLQSFIKAIYKGFNYKNG